jgi:TonB family protein
MQDIMHRYIFFILITVLSGCTQSTQLPPIDKSQQRKPSIQAASIKPGCLLPPPETIDVSTSGSIELRVEVSDAGTPLSTTVVKTSGNTFLDTAFQTAVLNCHFNPATSFNRYTHETTTVASNYVLTQGWLAGHKFFGPFRCFQPDYPYRAIRFQEQAKVNIKYRRISNEKLFEVKTLSPLQPQELASASLAATEGCLANKEVLDELIMDQWYEASIIWLLK